MRAGPLERGDLAAEEAVLLRLLLEETIDKRVEAGRGEIEVEHLRVYDALLGLNLLDSVDEI